MATQVIAGNINFPDSIQCKQITNTGTVTNGTFATGGTTLAAIAAGNRTANVKVGSLLFTGITAIGAGAADTLTIVNILAGTAGIVTLENTNIAVGASLYITSVVWNQNTSIVVSVQNGGAATTGVAFLGFRFMSFN
jgi:hypothetical protein